MRILVHLSLLLLLAGCAAPFGGPPADGPAAQVPQARSTPADGPKTGTAAKPAKPPTCRDVKGTWNWYLAGNISSNALIACSGIAGTLDPMLSLAVAETETSAARPEFERAVDIVRLLARSGDDRAQRALTDLYAGKRGWYGRNAYMALFWNGVIRKSDPSFRQTKAAEDKLQRFRQDLTPETARDLDASIAQWSPNRPVPSRLTIDSFLTFVIESDGRIGLPTRARIIDYGSEQDFRDWRMMFLMANQRRLSDQQRSEMFQQEADKGSLLALIFELSDVRKASGSDKNLMITKFLELLVRLGLDPTSFQPELFEDAVSVNADSTMADLDRLLLGRSRPEQRTVALVSLLSICGEDPGGLCSLAADRFDPILPRAARNLGRIVAVNQRCPGGADTLRCLSENNVLGLVRDLFALDYQDFSGQET